MKTVQFLSDERAAYYKAKKSEQQRQEQQRQTIIDDALFIHYYGMDAYLKLNPDAIDYSISWHRQVLKELQNLDKVKLANHLTGMSLAYSASMSKKSSNKFKTMIKGMLKHKQ